MFLTARSEEREDLFKWVGPFTEESYAFYATKGSGIKLTNLNDAKAYSVGVQRSGVSELFLKSQGFSKLDEANEPAQNLKRLLKGRFDLWFASDATVVDLLEQENVSPSEVEELYIARKSGLYIAFSKSTPEQTILSWQKAYDELYREGVIHKIFSAYDLPHLTPSLDTHTQKAVK